MRMRSGRMARWALGTLALAMTAAAGAGEMKPVKTELRGGDGKWQLFRAGQPFFIQGGGGDGDRDLLKAVGGNALRTWGVDDDTLRRLDDAHAKGLVVTVGHWLGHAAHGFDYDNAEQVAKQTADFRKHVEALKNHPAVLAWSLGNEMEIGVKNPEALWRHVNDLAKIAKQLDPNHPTMTVIADFDDAKIQAIHRFCPDVDIIGVNSYGGAASVAERYRRAGGVKPFALTEYGPHGIWEWAKTDWGAPKEPNSTEKGETFYRSIYEKTILAEKGKLCLGGYAFTWGYKVEGTPTWFGMLYPTKDGDVRLGAVDVMEEFWTGKKPAVPCPTLRSFTIDRDAKMPAGTTFTATLAGAVHDGAPARVEFELFEDSKEYQPYQGHGLPMPPTFPEAIVKTDGMTATVKLPDQPGEKRYFLYGRIFDTGTNHRRGAALAMIPLLGLSDKPEDKTVIRAMRPRAFPVDVYADGLKNPTWYPSGYMGNNGAIKMDERSADQPHSGATCLKVEYNAPDNWAGVYWQSPANDWNEQPGGLNLTGATKLSFWARGAKGGEKVKFMVGTAGRDKPFFDTAAADLEATLTPDWKEYSIPLEGKDLRRIKSGFGWVVAHPGAPMAFYLDDIRYEGQLPPPGTDTTAEPPFAAGAKATLPMAVLPEEAAGQPTWYPSGYMGNTGAVKMSDAADAPARGAQCLKVEYNAADNWAGVYWQNPANDWNDQPGGFDLTGATRLAFKARGAQGGERVEFLYGTDGRDKTYHDTANGKMNVTLTPEWQEYVFDLAGQDLRRIKSGFGWVVGGQGAPIAFYLDDLRYE